MNATSRETFRCEGCGETKPVQPSGGTGFATAPNGDVVCYGCCGWLDIATMLDGKAPPLYWESFGRSHVINWPGSLKLHVTGTGRISRVVVGGRFMGYKRTVYFAGPAGSRWSGVSYGTGTAGDFLRNVRRLK